MRHSLLRSILSISGWTSSSNSAGQVKSQLFHNIPSVNSCQAATIRMVHTKCRAEFYPFKGLDNSDEKVSNVEAGAVPVLGECL